MKAIILVVAASSLVTGTAFAAQMTGTINSISKKHDTITLSGGKKFHLPENIEVESLGVGETVKVSYTVGTGQRREVSSIRAAR